MATTSDKTATEVRTLLKDTNASDPVVSNDEVRQGINGAALTVSHELGLGSAWVTGAITTNTTDLDFTLPSTVEYHQVLQLVYAADRWPLKKVGKDEVLLARAGTSGSSGRHLSYSMDIGPSQVVTVSFPGKHSAVEAIDALVTTMPSKWEVQGTPVTIPFSRSGQRALELIAAQSIGRTAGPDVITALDLSAKTFDAWMAEAMELIRQERLSIIRLKRATGPSNYRWFVDWGLS